MTMTIRERVASGAKYLDSKYPNWAELFRDRVVTGNEMIHTDKCVYSTVVNKYEFEGLYGIQHCEEYYTHLHKNGISSVLQGFESDTVMEFEELAEVWNEKIAERLNPVIEVIKKGLEGFRDAWLVKKDTEYFVVSGVHVLGVWEVLVFPANENGEVTDWGEVAGGKGYTHEEAIAELERI